jgi:translation initiation factor IF-3
MKYRPKIGKGDFDTKTRQVAKFLADGHKVKVTIMFRGREVFHPELGRKILDGIAEVVEGSAKVESEARLDGRNMVMVLAPDRRARQSQAAKAVGNGVEAAPRTESPSTNGAASSPVITASPAAPSAAVAAPETVRDDAVDETEEEKPDAKDED